MNRKFFNTIITLLMLCGVAYVNPNFVYAKSDNVSLPTVSVINEIRGEQLGLEGVDLLESLKGQWGVTKNVGVSATWLWQYSAMKEDKLVEFAKKEMKNQEFGIFLEIDRNFADKSNVRYRGKGPWYFSDGLFLSSYEPRDREKLISEAFDTFKDTFGYYPKSVGAWWVGAESILFMQKKYGITSVLQCADQFDTDKYSLWGTPWSIPYAPAKRNSAISAQSGADAIPNLVVLQWATRDPVNAYGNSVDDSTFSIQDYAMKKYDADSYLTYLKNIYLKKPLDHMVVGLESGFSGTSYEDTYKNNLDVVKKWETRGEIRLQMASDYAEEFINKKNIYPPTHYFLTNGYQNNEQSFWYHSPRYRIAIHKKGNKVYLTDVRDYVSTTEEEFYRLPNTQSLIRINTKAIIDSVRFPDQSILLVNSSIPLKMDVEKDKVNLRIDGKIIASFTEDKALFLSLNDKEIGQSPNQFKRENIGFSLEFIRSHNIQYVKLTTLLLIMLYITYLIVKTSDKTQLAVSIFCVFFSLVVLFPIYTSGQFISDTMAFTPISLSIFPLLEFVPLTPSLKVFVIFQILPIAGIIIFNFLIFRKINKFPIIIFIYFVLAFVLFAYLDNYSIKFVSYFHQGRKAKLILALGALFLAAAFFVFTKLYLSGRFKLLTIIATMLCVLVPLINLNKIQAHKSFLITPFEQKMLKEIYMQRKKVVFPMPEFRAEDYQSITPLLAVDKSYTKVFASAEFESIPLFTKPYKFTTEGELIVIARYLGVEFPAEKEAKKIFDNAQIAIYKKN